MRPVLPDIKIFLTGRKLACAAALAVFFLAAPAHAQCTNPAGTEGTVIYNADYNVLQYCNNTGWRSMSHGKGDIGDKGPTDGLLHHWRLDSTAGNVLTDSVSGLTCPITGSSATVIPGPRGGNAILFNASDAYCTGIDNIYGISQLTLAGWFKREASLEKAFFGYDLGSGAAGMFINLNDTGNLLEFAMHAGAWQNGNISTFNDTHWHHIAMVFDGAQASNATRMRVYIDGIPVTLSFSGTIPAVTPGGDNSFVIGADGDAALDDLRIYNRALTADEVAQLAGVTTPPSGLVSHWTFDQSTGTTMYDYISGRNGTLTGGPAFVAGKHGGALDFSGAAQYVQVAHNGTLSLSNYTTMAWIKPRVASNASGTQRIIDKGTNYIMFWNHPSIPVSCQHRTAANAWPAAFSPTVYPAGEWVHLACAYDGTSIILYVNGKESARVAAAAPSTNTGPLNIGSNPNGFIHHFDGLIDDVRLYNRALSPSEIRSVLHGCVQPMGNPGDIRYDAALAVMVYCNSREWVAMSKSPLPSNEELVAHLPLEEGSGTATADMTGTHNGTLMNMIPGSWVAGQAGAHALLFDGSDDYIDLQNPTAFNFVPTGRYTWAAWIRPTAFDVWSTVFASFQTPEQEPLFAIFAHNYGTTPWDVTNGITAGLGIAGWAQYYIVRSTANALTLNNWAHIAVTYDGAAALADRMKIYINGIDRTLGHRTDGTLTAFNANGARIGNSGYTGENFHGSIDDFRFYKRVLTLPEIQALAGFNNSGVCTGPAGTAGQMIYNNNHHVVQFCNGRDWIAAGN